MSTTRAHTISPGTGRATTPRRWAGWTAGWAGGAVLAVVNGGFRDTVLVPGLGETTARQISTVTLLMLLTGWVWWLSRRLPLRSTIEALAVGALWVSLTLGFEFGFGHYGEGKSWATLLADYDVGAGRIWLLVPVWTLLAPAVVRRQQRQSVVP